MIGRDESETLTPVEARGAVKLNVMRYVLFISLALVIVAFAIIVYTGAM